MLARAAKTQDRAEIIFSLTKISVIGKGIDLAQWLIKHLQRICIPLCKLLWQTAFAKRLQKCWASTDPIPLAGFPIEADCFSTGSGNEGQLPPTE
jgi:hypothetical protein